MRGAALALALIASGCGGRVVVDHCRPVTLRAHDGPPIAAVGATPGDALPLALRARLTLPRGLEVHAVRWGIAPGWGCVTPARARVTVGTWTGEVEVTDGGDLGGGFRLAEGVLPAGVRLPEGEAVIGVDLAASVECGAKSAGPVGASWRGGETVDGALVIEAQGCGGQGQE